MKTSLLNFPIAVCGLFPFQSLLCAWTLPPSSHFYFLQRSPMFFLFLPRFFKGTSTAGACSSLIHKYDSLFARLSYFYFLDSLSRLLLSAPSFRCPCSWLFFNVQVLFLPSHTLINEFFLFPSFPAHRTFPAVSTSRLPRFPRKSPPLIPAVFFSGNREQSRQSTLLSTRPNFSHSAHPFWSRKLLPFCRRPFSLMSKRPPSFRLPAPHALAAPSRTLCSRSCMREQNPR